MPQRGRNPPGTAPPCDAHRAGLNLSAHPHDGEGAAVLPSPPPPVIHPRGLRWNRWATIWEAADGGGGGKGGGLRYIAAMAAEESSVRISTTTPDCSTWLSLKPFPISHTRCRIPFQVW